MAAQDLNGKWKLDRSENFDEYLKALGVGMVKRKVVSGMTPTVEIQQSGTHYVIINTTSFSTDKSEFDIGTEFEAEIKGVTDGTMKNVPSIKDGKLVISSTPGTAKSTNPTTTEREIINGELVQTLTCGGAVAKRIFKKC